MIFPLVTLQFTQTALSPPLTLGLPKIVYSSLAKGCTMLKIGDFSRLGLVSIDTLRHYDNLGLLKPADVDPSTGYRYYAYQQLGRLHRILALKDMGLSLEQIAPMLEGEISAEELNGMLKLKRAEIQENIDTESERLARVEA